MIVLHIDSSPRGIDSVSRDLTRQIIDRLKAVEPNLDIIRQDLTDRLLPHLSSDAISALRRAEFATAEQCEAATRSDSLIDELQRADMVVIGSPMHNFGITTQLKAWFDNVIRAGKTFRYGDRGPEGLLKNKRAIVVETRGGSYSEGFTAAFDHQEPHLKTLLSFIGISDVRFVRAEGLDKGPESRASGIAQAVSAVDEMLGRGRKQAA
jgi:FMN-dependent NADH-azoreductase